MLHLQKFAPAFKLQTLFVLPCYLAQRPETVAFCKGAVVSSCVGACSLINMVVPNVWQQ